MRHRLPGQPLPAESTKLHRLVVERSVESTNREHQVPVELLAVCPMRHRLLVELVPPVVSTNRIRNQWQEQQEVFPSRPLVELRLPVSPRLHQLLVAQVVQPAQQVRHPRRYQMIVE
jgi:hypothetical protein